MNVIELLFNIAFIVGFIIIYFHQTHSIKTLKSALSASETFMNIFNLEKIEQYVKIMEKTHKAEAKLLVETEKEQLKTAARKGIQYLTKEYGILYGFVLKLLFIFAFNQYVIKSIEEMPNSDIKDSLKSDLVKKQQDIRKLFPDLHGDPSTILTAVLMRVGHNLGN